MGPCTSVIGPAFLRISEPEGLRADVVNDTGSTREDPAFPQGARRDQALTSAIAVVLDREAPAAVLYTTATGIDVAEPVAGFKRQTADPFVLDLRERLNAAVQIPVLSALLKA